MATYRVGAAGATVFNKDGGVVARLQPGTVVVEGLVDTPGSSADQYRKLKQQRGYADKSKQAGRDYEDKSRQCGGPVFPGRNYVVGESGPELFTPQADGYIPPLQPKGEDE